MSQQQIGLPVAQIHAFWNDVEQHLRDEHGLDGDRPVRAILNYRNEIDLVGPMIYHRTSRDVATDIVTGGYANAGRMVS